MIGCLISNTKTLQVTWLQDICEDSSERWSNACHQVTLSVCMWQQMWRNWILTWCNKLPWQQARWVLRRKCSRDVVNMGSLLFSGLTVWDILDRTCRLIRADYQKIQAEFWYRPRSLRRNLLWLSSVKSAQNSQSLSLEKYNLGIKVYRTQQRIVIKLSPISNMKHFSLFLIIILVLLHLCDHPHFKGQQTVVNCF